MQSHQIKQTGEIEERQIFHQDSEKAAQLKTSSDRQLLF